MPRWSPCRSAAGASGERHAIEAGDGLGVRAASPAAAIAQAVTTHLRDIEARLDRLEKSVGRAIGLLQRLLHPERMGKPGTPVGR